MVMANSDTRRGFFLVVDAMTKQKEAAQDLDVGMSWMKSERGDELHKIQEDMDTLIQRLAAFISKNKP